MKNSRTIVAGGVDKYISKAPVNVHAGLNKIRAVIVGVAPDAIETVSYFNLPGYSYEGYAYNGMFVWFSYAQSFIRLHVIPPVIEENKELLAKYKTSKSVVNFPADEELPIELIKKLVRESLKVMKSK